MVKRNMFCAHLAIVAVVGMALFGAAGCGTPFDVSDSHQALSGTCTSTGNQPGDWNVCPITCPAPYLPNAQQFCDPITGSWTLCTCSLQPPTNNPDAGVGGDGRYCTLGVSPDTTNPSWTAGQLGWQYQLAPGVYSVCTPLGTPVECANGTLDQPCIFGTGHCAQPGHAVCDTTLAIPATVCEAYDPNPIAPEAEICDDNIDNDCNGLIDLADSLTCSGITCHPDADGDGFGTGAGTFIPNQITCPSGQAEVGGDCNDADPLIHPGAAEVCELVGIQVDNNCDGVVNENLVCASMNCFGDADDDGFGYGQPVAYAGNVCPADDGNGTPLTSIGGDCNDANDQVNPAAIEICDGIDNNCDGMIEPINVCNFVVCYSDIDGDGFGSGTGVPRAGTTCLQGEVTLAGDCDDTLLSGVNVYPGQVETCDGVDNDCNGTIDGGLLVCQSVTCWSDGDADGVGTGVGVHHPLANCPPGTANMGGDCNDGNPAIRPGRTELCNGIDDDCFGGIDDGLMCTHQLCYLDGDSDGFGTGMAMSRPSCLVGEVGVGGDCNDANPAIRPGAAELCDGVDNNCNATADELLTCATLACYIDGDGDGYGTGSPTILTNQTVCPGTQVTWGGDCNDADNSIRPNVVEVCGDGIDNDCDGVIDDGCATYNCYLDNDGDGYGAGASITLVGALCSTIGRVNNALDCNDANAAIHPAQTEVCDSVDNDCDSGIDEGLSCTQVQCYPDGDNDGFGAGVALPFSGMTCPSLYSSVAGDCNNALASTRPGAPELCDSVDNNCNGTIDEGCTTTSCYLDTDGDGVGAGTAVIITVGTCADIGRVTTGNDCQPNNAAVRPGIPEVCGNSVDDNCDGVADNGCGGGVTTSISAVISAGRTFVGAGGTAVGGVACPSAPIIIGAFPSLDPVVGASCTVIGQVVTCTGVPTGTAWSLRMCHNTGGTTYMTHTAYGNGGICAVAVAGMPGSYGEFASVTAANGSAIACVGPTGQERNGAL